MLRIDVITIFPGLFEAFLRESIVGIAIRENFIGVAVHDLREYTTESAPHGGPTHPSGAAPEW